MNSILWTRKAVKQLLRLHSAHQVQIRDAVTLLVDMPDTGNVKALSGHSYAYRLRVGNYRILRLGWRYPSGQYSRGQET
ncbi:hypothetical protein C4K20_5892 [Pseudomonas chlororaphis subsp. aurantiaca]|nr:hypothetical protein C4K20_5892 [Pseudomonas chlororaphis subsp. aurantiaca]